MKKRNWRVYTDKIYDLARISGTIIDATGILDPKVGYDLIDTIAADFSVNVIVTVGNERLYNDLLKRYQSRKDMNVVKVQRSGGVVETDATYLRSMQQRLFKQYFYGKPASPLSAFTVTTDISAFTVYKRAERKLLFFLYFFWFVGLLIIYDSRSTSRELVSSSYWLRSDFCQGISFNKDSGLSHSAEFYPCFAIRKP